MTSTRALTLAELQASANGMRVPAIVTNTGGGVMALAFTVDARHALLALDDGHLSGTEWVVALDGETREEFGEDESSPIPVMSDADQIMRDAIAWVRATVAGIDPSVNSDY